MMPFRMKPLFAKMPDSCDECYRWEASSDRPPGRSAPQPFGAMAILGSDGDPDRRKVRRRGGADSVSKAAASPPGAAKTDGSMHFPPIDARQVERRAEERVPSHLRPGHVGPLAERDLACPADQSPRDSAVQPCQELDVEDPAAPERSRQGIPQGRPRTEELGSALRIVDGSVQGEGHGGGEDPAEVVPLCAALDAAAQQEPPRG